MTQPIDGAPDADPHGWCHWHKGPSRSAELIEVIKSGPSVGYEMYACGPCREQRHLTPHVEPASPLDLLVPQLCETCGETTTLPTRVGIHHAGSGGGRVMYACPSCQAGPQRLLPLDRHPRDSYGFPRLEL
ncbi:hypothetical protein [Streptomyces sp. NRRL F-5135]|uniref:hypothetical protein n=1 Tax=Streptomyces sp. NRRL F-5135 TaxID=1463858 RepID=UPI00068EC3CC|nr:hypothetical protein [Streptomyces sp. NRRL F-5135]